VLPERGSRQHAPTGTVTVPAGTAGAEAAGGNLRLPCRARLGKLVAAADM